MNKSRGFEDLLGIFGDSKKDEVDLHYGHSPVSETSQCDFSSLQNVIATDSAERESYCAQCETGYCERHMGEERRKAL